MLKTINQIYDLTMSKLLSYIKSFKVNLVKDFPVILWVIMKKTFRNHIKYIRSN